MLRRSRLVRMADDREVLREIWDGRLPVCFNLASEEAFSLNVPDPFYLMVPRLLYFPLITDKVRKHFVQYINPESASNEMWLDFNGQPIKWNYPIGVWFDQFCSEASLPWTVTVHFEDYPEKQILRCTSKEAIKTHFMSCLKEADSLKHRGQVVNSMQEKEHTQLWTGFQNDKFDQFWNVNKKMMESPAGEGFKNLPIRFYVNDKIIQRLIRPICENTGSWTILREVLSDIVPDVESVRVVTHGIHLSLQEPLQWLSEHLSYPDNFLHLSVLDMKSSSQDQDSASVL